MAENLEISVKSEKSSTRKTAKLTPEQAVEILEDTILKCQQAGLKAGLREYHCEGEHGIEIILIGVAISPDRHLVCH